MTDLNEIFETIQRLLNVVDRNNLKNENTKILLGHDEWYTVLKKADFWTFGMSENYVNEYCCGKLWGFPIILVATKSHISISISGF